MTPSYSKADQLSRPRKKRESADKGKESELQRKCDEYLEWKHIPFIRIPDHVYRIIFGNQHIPNHHRKIIAKYLKGLPDLTIFRKQQDKYKPLHVLADEWKKRGAEDMIVCANELEGLLFLLETHKYNDALCIELKSAKGTLSHHQQHWADQVETVVVRSFDEFVRIVEDFECDE